MKVCLIEDDLKLGRALLATLDEAGHRALWLRCAGDGATRLRGEAFDALLLDLGLPDMSGFELLRILRADRIATPVLIITARHALEDRVRGLDLGADDYLVKPFATDELLARLRAVVRRVAGAGLCGNPVWTVRDLTLEESTRIVIRAGQQVALSKTEFALLLSLVREPGHVRSRDELERQVLLHADAQALDVHVHKLRKKLGGDYIQTVHGVGYVVRP